VDKPKIMRNELEGLELEANRLFSRELPYCDVDLVPAHGFDPEKSSILLDNAGGHVK